MSVNSWLKEFYPVDASEGMTNLEAVRHSLKKWRGLKPENLERHRVDVKAPAGYFRSGRLLTGRSQGHLLINDSSCALCHKHSEVDDCKSCPIVRTVGRRCDKRVYVGDTGGGTSPWHRFDDMSDPEPMIAVLEKAEAALIREQARRKK